MIFQQQTAFVGLNGGGSGALLLDTFPIGSGSAYSVRKLRTGYTGACLRVRRSSDNTEQDIGFTSAGGLDTSALSSFVGAGNGFVTKWYDQSGNAIDVANATTGQQPRIANAGVVEAENSLPTVTFDGTDDVLFSGFSSSVTVSTRRFTSAVVVRSLRTSSSDEAFVATKRSALRDYDTGFIVGRSNTYVAVQLNTGANANNNLGRRDTDANITALTLNHYFITPQTPADVMYVDGVAKALATFYTNGTGTIGNHQSAGAGSHRIMLGAGAQTTSNTVFDRFFQGKLSEVILWPEDWAASRATLALNQKTYFGTP